jgi:hypothetical protein
VLTFRRLGACEPERAFEALPPGFHAVAVRVGWLVIGPTGAFLVVDDDVVPDAGSTAVAAAAELRRVLSERTTWVPFIEPLVVSSDPAVDRAAGAAPVIPSDLLVSVIAEGHPTVDAATVRRTVDLVSSL